jgi:parvulin-like peptidyl-prolyl isomerase
MSKKKKNIISQIKLAANKIFKNFKKISFKKENFKLTPLKIGILSFILLLGVLFLIKSLIFAAFVNGRPIFRLSVVSIAEKQNGSTVLANLIEKELIFNEAKKAGIKISEQMVDEEINNINEILKQQNITLEQALKLSKQDLKSLREQIKIQKIVEQILGSKITIQDSEISDYFATNKEYFGANAKIDDVKDQIKEELFKQKLSSEYTSWIEEIKVNAKIKYIVNY